MRLEGKVALVVGAGQIPGETIGNGRATSLLFAREGARLFLVDIDLESAQETARLVREEGGTATAMRADVGGEADCAAFVAACMAEYGRIDILHNNVGIAAGDASGTKLTEEAWDRIVDTNLKGMMLSCKHAVPAMREGGGGSIINISSVAAVCSVGMVAYKVSKAGVNALTHSVAMSNARHGIRANVIMPGLMDTPNAIEVLSSERDIDKQALREQRNKSVPLGGQMGTAWDVAYAALFLASDESRFITAVELPVDGGQRARIG